jgi:hypothetical protein
MNIHTAHHIYKIATRKKWFGKYFFLRDFSSAAPNNDDNEEQDHAYWSDDDLSEEEKRSVSDEYFNDHLFDDVEYDDSEVNDSEVKIPSLPELIHPVPQSQLKSPPEYIHPSNLKSPPENDQPVPQSQLKSPPEYIHPSNLKSLPENDQPDIFYDVFDEDQGTAQDKADKSPPTFSPVEKSDCWTGICFGPNCVERCFIDNIYCTEE